MLRIWFLVPKESQLTFQEDEEILSGSGFVDKGET
jgi:hypothetical protein